MHDCKNTFIFKSISITICFVLQRSTLHCQLWCHHWCGQHARWLQVNLCWNKPIVSRSMSIRISTSPTKSMRMSMCIVSIWTPLSATYTLPLARVLLLVETNMSASLCGYLLKTTDISLTFNCTLSILLSFSPQTDFQFQFYILLSLFVRLVALWQVSWFILHFYCVSRSSLYSK